jgi:predicted aspartyl protease
MAGSFICCPRAETRQLKIVLRKTIWDIAMMSIRFALLCVVLVFSSTVFAEETITNCDKYAASNIDPNAKAPGIPFDELNSAQAIQACEAAIRQSPNNPRFLFQLGRAYQKARNVNSTLKYYRNAAEMNYAPAQESLGDMYSEGFFLSPEPGVQFAVLDAAQAVSWYRKAAEQGLAIAQNNLAIAYRDGKGIKKDKQEAATWFRKAADQGFADAEKNLAALQQEPAQAELAQVQMQRQGGIFVVPVLINNAISINFAVDSGASDVSIPADVVLTLVRTGTLKQGDFLGTKTYVIADGSKVPSPQFRIRSLTVGSWFVENVTGHVGPVKSPPLLGQSFLKRFGSWSMDNAQGLLMLKSE